MSQLEEMINGVLNDPEQMKKIMDIAGSIMGGSGESQPEGEAAHPSEPPSDLGGIMKGLSGLSGIPGLSGLSGGLGNLAKGFLSGAGGRDEEKTALLEAMRPWLSEKRQGKLDRAMKLARVMRIAGAAFLKNGGLK